MKKRRCYNCAYAGQQFKVGKLTHLHCESPKMKEYFEKEENPSVWESLRVFSNTCREHSFKGE